MTSHDAIAQGLLDARASEEAWASLRALSTEDQIEVVQTLKAAVEARMGTAPPEALEAARVLLRVAEEVPGQQALGLRGYAGALHYNARYQEALDAFRAAAEAYERQEDALSAARVRRNLVDVHMYLGDTEAALACADQARRVFEEASSRWDLASLDNNVGNVYTRLDEYPSARRYYDQARRAFRDEGDVVRLAITAFNLGVVEMNANDCDASETSFRQAREAFDEASMALYVADCDYSLAYLESRRGRFAEAIRGLEAARVLYEQNGKPSGPPLCDLDLAGDLPAPQRPSERPGVRRAGGRGLRRAGPGIRSGPLWHPGRPGPAEAGRPRRRGGPAGGLRGHLSPAGEPGLGLGRGDPARGDRDRPGRPGRGRRTIVGGARPAGGPRAALPHRPGRRDPGPGPPGPG